MTEIIIAEILGVFLAWVVTGYAIWKWGPGLRRRTVACPEKNHKASVLADQREAEFGCLRVADISTCSLLSPGTPECAKSCLARF